MIIATIMVLFTIVMMFVKLRPNGRNVSTQRIAILLSATCCAHLATLSPHVGVCWTKLENGPIVPPSNVAICCVEMLRSFGRGFIHRVRRNVVIFYACSFENELIVIF